jgi:transposase InsO family protein
MAGVSSSAYFKYKRTPLKDESELKEKILDLYRKSGRRAGYRMIKDKLKESYGLVANHKKVLRLMQELCISSIIRKKYKSNRGRENIKENLLNREFTSNQPLKKIVTDITYIPCREKMVYLCTMVDLFNNEPVAWIVKDNQDKNLTLDTLKVLSEKYDLSGSLIHSDQGVHYRSHEYVKQLEELGVTQSMSRKGNCWDNAKAENFFSHFKCETIKLKKKLLGNVSDVVQIVDEYMDYYIHHRPQRKLKGMSPSRFKQFALGT